MSRINYSLNKAKFLDYRHVLIRVPKLSLPWDYQFEMFVGIDNEKTKVKILSRYYENGEDCYYLETPEDIDTQKHYFFKVYGDTYTVDNSELIYNKDFDTKTYYDDELGAIVKGDKTIFRLWAPLCAGVFLILNIDGFKAYIDMKPIGKGVFEAIINQNLDGSEYIYQISFSNCKTIRVIDPYGYTSTPNGEYSVVVDLDKLKIDMNDDKLSKFDNYLDAIIYEGHVRDLTISKNTDIENKGKFLGLCEENKKTKSGNKAGFDYIKSLGITHLQLLPVLDYATVDEKNPSSSYNWGYDPYQFFTLEGSYASDINNPKSRITDFLRLVSLFHRNNIRINLDVVYNHVYKVEDSILEKIVPNYYFRKKDNEFSNCSGCGNDLATEKPMVRKLIIDSLTFLLKTYHVDGFRFDLMGLIDVETLKQIEDKLRSIKPDIMLYGEGWNMTDFDNLKFGNLENNSLLPDYAFFNDRYRDILKGNTFKLHEKGYGIGDSSYRDGFKFAYCGSSKNITYPALLTNKNQSINYVECHDNGTLFDKISKFYEEKEINQKLKRVSFINSILLLSQGIPLIHAGQEIGQTKFGKDNTYNLNNGINDFNYDLLDERINMSNLLSSIIKIRKEINFINYCEDIEFEDIGKSGLIINFKDCDKCSNYKEFKLLINPDDKETIYHNLNKDYKIYSTTSGEIIKSEKITVKNLILDPISYVILYIK